MTLYELFFEIEVSLSDRFPALSPLTIREKRAREVFLLIRRLTDYNRRQNKSKTDSYTPTGDRIIRRPAGNDWF